jgi:hypothetical protein
MTSWLRQLLRACLRTPSKRSAPPDNFIAESQGSKYPIQQNQSPRRKRSPARLPFGEVVQIEAFVADYNHRRYHESIGNLTPAFGRGQTILIERQSSIAAFCTNGKPHNITT